MQIVIDIDDKLYKIIKDPKKLETMYHAGRLCEAVRKGQVLPKGHGRLFDERDIVSGNYEVIGNRIYELEPIIGADEEQDMSEM